MAGAELIVLGFGAREEARDPAELAEGVEPLASAGEHLVDVGLMPGIPHELVARRIEDAVERDCQLDRAEA